MSHAGNRDEALGLRSGHRLLRVCSPPGSGWLAHGQESARPIAQAGNLGRFLCRVITGRLQRSQFDSSDALGNLLELKLNFLLCHLKIPFWFFGFFSSPLSLGVPAPVLDGLLIVVFE
jgi:hypothetical protein